MSRGYDEIHHEAQYWSLAVENLAAMNDAIGRAAERLADTPLPLLQLAVLERHTEHAETVMAAVQAALGELRAMQPNVTDLADLARGRHKVLQQELDELADDDDDRRDA